MGGSDTSGTLDLEAAVTAEATVTTGTPNNNSVLLNALQTAAEADLPQHKELLAEKKTLEAQMGGLAKQLSELQKREDKFYTSKVLEADGIIRERQYKIGALFEASFVGIIGAGLLAFGVMNYYFHLHWRNDYDLRAIVPITIGHPFRTAIPAVVGGFLDYIFVPKAVDNSFAVHRQASRFYQLMGTKLTYPVYNTIRAQANRIRNALEGKEVK